MLIRNPCKRCIVRPCCTMKCRDKEKQINTISWIKQNWVYSACCLAEVLSVIWVIIYVTYNLK